MFVRFGSVHRKRLLIYLLILAGVVVFASLEGGLFPYFCLYAALFYLPFQIVLTGLYFLFFKCWQELPDHVVVKGEENPYRLVLENTGFLPINDLILHPDQSCCTLHGVEEGETISLKSGEKKEKSGTALCRYAGTYEIGVKEAELWDPFLIFSLRVTIPAVFRVTVRPRITDAAQSAVDFENQLAAARLTSTQQLEELPGNEMRPLLGGESLRQVNWKVSARMHKLLTCLPDKKDLREVQLILIARNKPAELFDLEEIKCRDRFLEFAVSAAWYFGNRHEPVRMIYPRGGVIERVVSSPDTFLDFYEDISMGPFYNTDEEADRLKAEAVRRESDGTDCIVLRVEEENLG